MALAAMSKEKWKSGTKNQKKKFCCYKCGESGHFRKDCPQEKRKDKSNDQAKDAKDGKKKVLGAMKVHLNNITSEIDSEATYHDNGANDHLCNNRSWFSNMRPAFGTIEMPNGGIVNIVGQGM